MPDPLQKHTWGEIILIVVSTLLAVLVGTVLLVGELRLILVQTLQNFATSLAGRLTAIRIPPSVAILSLGAAAVAATYFGSRYVILQAFPRHHKEEICPRCGKDIHMIHRTWADRLASFALRGHLQRYRCFNCSWTGLHRQRKHHK